MAQPAPGAFFPEAFSEGKNGGVFPLGKGSGKDESCFQAAFPESCVGVWEKRKAVCAFPFSFSRILRVA